MKAPRIILSGGGTGGHVFPAIAIANAIREIQPESEILFVGARGRMEMEKVPQSGYEIEGLNIAGFQRGLSLTSIRRNLSFPFKLLSSLYRARSIVKNFKADVVVGTGGYASGPVLRMAQNLGIATLIQEQNSLPGVTNQLLAKKAVRICVCFEEMDAWFDPAKTVLTGNPVRSEIVEMQASRKEACQFYGLDEEKPILFITGGSLGAKAINAAISKNLESLRAEGIQIIWQTGKFYLDQYKHLEAPSLKIMDFVRRMDLAYAAADLIVSRAGGTIAELAIVGKACILLPSPHVAEDHQTKNVQALVKKDAAILIRDEEADEKLGQTIIELIQKPERRKQLSEQIAAMARPDAANHIAREVLALVS
jgi:UDP-N-acetylglucosamine--N-acetylmuramyl-(pentapeptide) pyrophosphoryl-undecaprenol N-acetylglucosamine transferase